MVSQSDVTTNVSVPTRLSPNKTGRVGSSLLQIALYRLRHDTLTIIALTVLAVLTVLSIAAPVISEDILHVDPNSTDGYQHMLPIGAPGHVLGTDNIGRDQLSRLLF